MKGKLFPKWAILLPITVFLLLGCGGKGKGVKTIEGDPEVLYKQGLTRFNKRDYPEALKKFEELKSSFPDSPPYTVWAELKIGDCHLLKKEYVEAIAAYEEFKKIHPTHEEIQYVQYQIGMAYFDQMLTLDRDQTSTVKALSSFEYLVSNYPPGLFTGKANEKIGTCRKRLADHEFYIGDFYYKKGKFQAAASRFEGLLIKFPKISEEDKTFFFLGKSYLELDQEVKAREAFSKIIIEYPKSAYYKEAKALLDQGVREKKVSSRKGTVKKSKKEAEPAETEPERIALVKFEEEGRQPVSLKEEKKVELERAEGRATSLPFPRDSEKPVPSKETTRMTPPLEPIQEDRVEAVPLPRPEAKPIMEAEPGEEKRIASLPDMPTADKEKENPKKGDLQEPGKIQPVDTSQPIDISSDRVEAYSKENLIVFKGNVMARQKDIVIYADTLEAVLVEGGKGIEKVIAGGNVKIQQGVRVANCQKAVFYNLDQKVVLTGDPKVLEGDNIVSGDEIIFHIEENQVEVKGGPGGRGKANIHPGAEFENQK